jgi:Zn-dependent protease with chaperone function
MSISLVVGLAIAAGVLPATLGRWLVSCGSPRQIIVFAIGSLSCMALGFVVALGAIVDPSALPARDLPQLVGQCVGAASRLLNHPLRHWPRILAALLLVGVAARLAFAGAVIIRDLRRQARSVDALASEVGDSRRGPVLVVPSERLFAFAVGVLRRRVVVSHGLMTVLGPRQRAAVLAHERAHVRGWHTAFLLFGRSVGRAFSFIPPVRRAASQLVLGLEMAADDAAAESVGDPMVVAGALVDLAGRTTDRPNQGLGAAGGELQARVKRLTRPHAGRVANRRAAWVALPLVGALLMTLLLAFPVSARSLSGRGRDRAIHDVCHLPHSEIAVARSRSA